MDEIMRRPNVLHKLFDSHPIWETLLLAVKPCCGYTPARSQIGCRYPPFFTPSLPMLKGQFNFGQMVLRQCCILADWFGLDKHHH
jgi:hypothetical protein